MKKWDQNTSASLCHHVEDPQRLPRHPTYAQSHHLDINGSSGLYLVSTSLRMLWPAGVHLPQTAAHTFINRRFERETGNDRKWQALSSGLVLGNFWSGQFFFTLHYTNTQDIFPWNEDNQLNCFWNLILDTISFIYLFLFSAVCNATFYTQLLAIKRFLFPSAWQDSLFSLPLHDTTGSVRFFCLSLLSREDGNPVPFAYSTGYMSSHG